MTRRSNHFHAATALIAALGLDGCGSDEKAKLDQVDQELAASKAKDPAVQSAIEGQIMVDPGLADKANEHSVRPTNQPNADALPLPGEQAASPNTGQPPAALAGEQARINRENFAACQLDVAYSASFAARLPADLPLFAGGRVVEAAGSDTPSCRLRAVTYSARAPLAEVAGYYKALATKAGYRVGEKVAAADHLISGQRAGDRAAFYVILQPAGVGTMVDLVANNGR
jgi:hypothetical protein